MLKRLVLILAVMAAFVAAREVPVRYWVAGDSVELEAIFVKTEKDTVYLKRPNVDEQKRIEEITDQANVALQESNGQKVEEEESLEEEEEVKKEPAEVIMTEAIKDSAAIADSIAAAAAAEPVDDGSDDDFETALQKEETRLKKEEIAKIEEEIRERDIQDSLKADSLNPFIKIYRYNLKRLFNLEDNVMIDLALSDYIVPELEVEKEEQIELYPAGNANLLVTSFTDVCSLYVNGIPLKQVTPDTIKNIKPGKYTISVMRVFKDMERWGSAVVRINADSLNKVAIPIENPSTRLTLNTDPEAVEVYVNRAPDVNHFPQYITDIIVNDVKPQPKMDLYFRKVGYRDTTISIEVKAYMPNLVNVEMEPILEDLALVEQQNAFNKERSERRVGRWLLGSSLVPFIAGGVMWYLAERDWTAAADKKKAYKLAAFESPDTQKMVKDNHRLNKSGDIKGIVAGGLGAIGLGLFVVGIVYAF